MANNEAYPAMQGRGQGSKRRLPGTENLFGMAKVGSQAAARRLAGRPVAVLVEAVIDQFDNGFERLARLLA